MNYRRRQRFSLWVLPAAFVIGGAIFAVLLFTANYMKPQKAIAKNATAVVTMIYAPTSTPVLHATLAVTPSPTAGSSGITVGGIGTGLYVQISGTGGDGLRLRKDPGTGADILFLGYDAEVFKVTDGPREQDGYIWWYLTAPYDTNRSGWAASNFLTIIEMNP